MVASQTVLRSFALLAGLLATLGWAGIGRADDPRVEARAHYAKGLELAGQSGYEAALREFNAAYEISPQFAVLFNIGQAHIALSHTVEAIDALTRYLHDGGDRISPTRRAQVERQIAGLRSTLPNPRLPPAAEAARATAAAAGTAAREATEATSEDSRGAGPRLGTLTIRCSERGLKLMLDGKPIDAAASSRGLAVSGGTHHLVMSAAGRRSAEETLEISAGGLALVICENFAAATAPPAIVPPKPVDSSFVFAAVPPNPNTPTVHAKTVAYILGGLGVALGGTAIGVYFWNRGQYQDAQADQTYLHEHKTDTERAVSYNAEVDALNRNSYLTFGLAAASVGLLGGATYLYLHERKRDAQRAESDSARSWASVTPGGVFWNGVW
jgi:tetratricopeptide (TPR) repeat protein